jgi:peptidoglycan/LPS O-acetylase OafA/YrhL
MVDIRECQGEHGVEQKNLALEGLRGLACVNVLLALVGLVGALIFSETSLNPPLWTFRVEWTDSLLLFAVYVPRLRRLRHPSPPWSRN